MTQELVSRALFQAVGQKRPPAGLIHHSDRGSQYCSAAFQKLLAQFGMRPSMSRKGNCYDNAPMESFWGSLMNKWVHHYRDTSQRSGHRLDPSIHRGLLQPPTASYTP